MYVSLSSSHDQSLSPIVRSLHQSFSITCPFTQPSQSSHPMVTHGKLDIHKPYPNYAKALTTTIHTNIILLEPFCYEEAKGIPEWEEAMKKEYEALL